ncbi:hypothetical protein [Kitasatospora mediocidica]|uniref:hypothetical protein n=1 Tax=Kitasatospora mediocidica TaxID=58352 RepID=UPI0005671AB5|nr:hypothetical protein [Kitasatospora mediocidica]
MPFIDQKSYLTLNDTHLVDAPHGTHQIQAVHANVWVTVDQEDDSQAFYHVIAIGTTDGEGHGTHTDVDGWIPAADLDN